MTVKFKIVKGNDEGKFLNFLCNDCKGDLTRVDEKYIYCPRCNITYNELEIYEFKTTIK